jgi:hypothetical protein
MRRELAVKKSLGGLNFQCGSMSLVGMFVPSGRTIAGGLVTQWKNSVGTAGIGHLTSVGSPPVDNSNALGGVSLDGSTQYLDASVGNLVDTPMTVFVLSKGISQTGDRRWLIDFSDTAAGFRSNGVVEFFNQRGSIHEFTGDTGNAGYVDGRTDVMLTQHTFTARNRSVDTDGAWAASSCFPIVGTRTLTHMRVGGGLDGLATSFWRGTVMAIFIYTGEPSERDARRINKQILRWAQKSVPADWPTYVNTDFGAPRIILEPILYAITGKPVQIWKAAVSVRDVPTDASTYQITCDLTVDSSYSDRWIVTPQAPGDYNISISVDGTSKSGIIRAINMPAAPAKKRVLLMTGDSNFSFMSVGAFNLLFDDHSSRFQWVGTLLGAGALCKNEGIGSMSFAGFDDATSGFPVHSPWFTAGVIDVETYLRALDDVPDVMFHSALSNDIYLTAEGSLDATITTAFGHLEHYKAAFSSAVPGLVHVVCCPTGPGGMNIAFWVGTGGLPNTSQQALHRTFLKGAERVISDYGGQEASGVWILNAQHRFDPWNGYRDILHVNGSRGQDQYALAIEGILGHILNVASKVLRVVSVAIDNAISATQVRVTYSRAVTASDAAGLSLQVLSGAAITISAYASGTGTATIVYTLSRTVLPTDSFRFRVVGARTVAAVDNSNKAACFEVPVTLQNFPPLPVALGVNAWFRSDDAGASITQDGSHNISQWSDQSGHARHATEATNKPIYTSNFGDGKPAIDFGAVAVLHLELATLPIDITTDFTIIVFCLYRGAGIVFGQTESADGNGDGLRINLTSGFAQVQFLDTPHAINNQQSVAMAANQWHRVVVRRTGTTLKICVDSRASELTVSITATPPGGTLHALLGGYRGVGGFADFNGVASSYEFFNSYLSDANVDALLADSVSREGNNGATR